jgi:nitrogen fixation/metabolism regulation signal transduction histidine kinase
VPFAVEFALVGIGGVLLVIWYILIARRLFMLAQDVSKEKAKQPPLA